MKQLARKWLMGNAVFSEYSKITVPDGMQEKAYLEIDGRIMDISENHWLLCIEPIVFGVWIEKEHYAPHKPGMKYGIRYGDATGRKEAVLELGFFNCIEEKNGALLLMELKKSNIYHLSLIKMFLIFFRYYKKDGLSFARFKSFVSAYSYPRRVRIISFRQNEYYNIFPMDLLGDIKQCNRFVFGLRHSNIALPRIIETGKLAVSEVPFAYKNIIYQLGRHHSGNPPPPGSLPFDLVISKNFGFYIPAWAERYKEIKILKTMNLGSHMLLWGELVEENVLAKPAGHLYVVHFLHYLYKKNKGLSYPLV